LADGTGTLAVLGHCVRVWPDGTMERLFRGHCMHQPSIFWRWEVSERVGLLDESRHYIVEFDCRVRISRRFDFHDLDLPPPSRARSIAPLRRPGTTTTRTAASRAGTALLLTLGSGKCSATLTRLTLEVILYDAHFSV
jgi:hypothetical protein